MFKQHILVIIPQSIYGGKREKIYISINYPARTYNGACLCILSYPR